MALTDFLTQVANAIRSKDGTTDSIVATDFPQRILDIPSGGSQIATGTIILESDQLAIVNDYNTKPFKVEHGLSAIPSSVIMWCDSEEDTLGSTVIMASYSPTINSIVKWNTDAGAIVQQYGLNTVDETYFYVNPPASGYYFRAGYVYRWVAF